jgi:hypothetical protein
MSKTTYLIISGILAFGFLQNNLLPFITIDLLLVMMLIWSIFGYIYIKEESVLNNMKNQKWIFVFFILFFLSSLTPMFRYNQDLLSTWVAMRTNFAIIYLLTLLKIAPNEEEIFKSFRFLGYLALISAIFVILWPELFVDKKDILGLLKRQKSGSMDIAAVWPGSICAVFYFYILLQRMIEKSTIKNTIWCSVFIGYIFLMQNRSTMICAVPFYLYGIMKADIKYKLWIIMFLCLSTGAFVYNIVDELIEESQKQLGNTRYNRWQAIYFFLTEQKNNLYTILFGHGVPSKGSAYLNHILKAQTGRLAFISDIGLLGTYFYYGLATMAVIYRFILKGICNNRMPRFLQYYCWWILLVPTIHSIGLGSSLSMIQFAFLFYLIIYYEYSSQNGCVNNNSKLQYA